MKKVKRKVRKNYSKAHKTKIQKQRKQKELCQFQNLPSLYQSGEKI